MPSMNPHTMNWSLRLSRWKHMVVTSLSAAPLQMGSDCDRQKFRLHWLHDEEEELPCARRVTGAARLFLRFFSMPVISPAPASSSKKSRMLRASWSSSSWAASLLSPSSGSVVPLPPPDGGWCCEGGLDEEPPPVEDLGLISMIVLFVKQVHLQNVGAAVLVNARSVRRVRLKGAARSVVG